MGNQASKLNESPPLRSRTHRTGLLVLAGGLVAAAALVLGAWQPDPSSGSPLADGHEPRSLGSPAADRETASDDTHGTDDLVAEPSRTIVWLRGLDRDEAHAIQESLADHPSTMLRGDVVGIRSVADAAGDVVLLLSDGFRIPMSVLFIDPATFTEVVHQGDAGAAPLVTLERGQAVLSQSAARLRDVGVGGQLSLIGTDGELRVTVTAIIDDPWTRRNEMVLHAGDADALGMDDGFHTVGIVRDDDPTATRRILDRVGALIGRHPTSAVDESDRQPSPHIVLSLIEVKQRFGEFAYRPRAGTRDIDIDPEFVDEMIVTVVVAVVGEVRCHRDIIDDLSAALDAIVAAGLDDWIDPSRYAGCHYPRRISPDRARLSHHSWGIAIDLNVDLSLPGLGPEPPEAIIDIFGRHGFRWGGDFSQPDNHHWEWVGTDATHRPRRPLPPHR